MSLTEKRVQKQVTTLAYANAIQVQWANQILRGEEVISEIFERKAYTQDQVAEFADEVEKAADYMAIMGWQLPSSAPE